MEVTPVIDKLQTLIQTRFAPNSYPCLQNQLVFFDRFKPLKGIKILSATPVFPSLLPKILPLIASEAEITITNPSFIEPDSKLVNELINLGFKYSMNPTGEFDAILDCAASQKYLNPKFGFVELTKTGESILKNAGKNFISIDGSQCKKIEDEFGTSDGFIRALDSLSLAISKKKFLLIGHGKVGSGISKAIDSRGGEVRIIDPLFENDPRVLDCNMILDFSPDYVVTSTGVKNVVEKHYPQIANTTSSVLINMGAEDEYGQIFESSRVLNGKKPLNFILKEPTMLKFLDPSFALHNMSLLTLIQSNAETVLDLPIEFDSHYKNIFHENS